MSANRGSLYVCDMTIRERFAAMAMQGLLAGPEAEAWGVDCVAKTAVRQADALLVELAKPQEVAP